MNNETNINEVKPYPGLRCFQYKENYLFFGREGKAQEIASRLQESHFLAVVGTSGSGKSSLVRAGLLPLLYGGMLYEFGSHWRIALMRPEETPIHNLAEALTYPVDFETEENGSQTKDENQIAIAEATLRRSGVGLLDFLNNPANKFDDDENLLIVVDQFEELFRFKEKSALEDTEEAAAFVKLLLEATRDKNGRIFVVITMRSDFLGDCAEFRDLPEAINDGQYLIPRMTRDQLRQSIESPAFVGDAQVSPALVNRLLNDLEDQNQALDVRDRIVKDHLPVLAHALMRTWDLWKKRGESDKPIDVEHYDNEEIGGMAHALSIHADEAYNDLSESQKLIAKKMFRCLTETDSENRETRRPAKIEEIVAVTGASKEVICEIIDVFRQEKEGRTFLMPPEGVELTKETKVDISHESLIRNWEILKGWVRDEAKDAWIYRRVSEAALILRQYEDEMKAELAPEEFERNCRDFLWRGIELKAALKWRDTFEPNVNWAARYQPLTETEKLELRELSRTSPKSEPAKRWEFIQLHFDKMMEFLERSAQHEAVEQAKEEQIQQERMLAAEQLAEVEREKVEGLKNLTDSLKRQRRFLFVVSIFSVLMMVAASVTAIVAWQYYNSAIKAQAESEKQQAEALRQKDIAEGKQKEADEQRVFAEIQQTEAEKQQDLAEKEKKNAEDQTKIAESQKTEAEKQKKIAEGQKEKVVAAESALRSSFDTLQEAQNTLQKTVDQNLFNLQGLSAYENYDYVKALENFQKLESKYDAKNANDTEGIWWAKYNIAKSNERLGRFDDAEKAYQSALDKLPKYAAEEAEKAGLQQFPGVSFINASYKPEPAEVGALKEDKIITLRKFALFYRNCAANPDDCFDNYTPDQPREDGYYETDTVYLNQAAAELYTTLLRIKEPKSVEDDPNLSEKDKIFLADVKTELADTYFDTYDYQKAQDYYEAALKVYGSLGGKKTLTEISIRKKLLETVLLIPKYAEADNEADTILRKKTEFLTDLYSRANKEAWVGNDTAADIEKKITFDKSLGVTYGELAAVYRRYADAVRKDFISRVDAEKDKINNKKAVDTSVIQSNPNAMQKTATETPDEDGTKKLVFLDRLDGLLYEQQRDTSGYSEWEKSIFKEASVYADVYRNLLKRSVMFSDLAVPLAAFNTDGNQNDPDRRILTYTALARAYVKMGEFKKSDIVIADYYKYIDSQYSDPTGKYFRNKAKYAQYRLEMPKVLSQTYIYTKDYCKAAELSVQWADEFERQFPNPSDFKEGIKHIYFFESAVAYHSLCGNCSGSVAKKREMQLRYLRYFEKNEANFPEISNETGYDKIYATRTQIEGQLSIGQTYESEKNAADAIKTYQDLLRKLQKWQEENQNPVSSNASNAAAPTPTPSATSDEVPIGDRPSKADWDKIFFFYESYLRVHLAELDFDRDQTKARNLPVKYTENFTAAKQSIEWTDSAPIILKYAVSTKNIGDLLKQNDRKQAERYYQSSIEAFEAMSKLPYFSSTDPSLEEYAVYGLFTKKLYADYISVLRSLKELKGGVDPELDKKIGILEEALKKASAAQTKEKTKCTSAQ